MKYLLLFMLPLLLAAEPVVRLPAEVKAKPGRLIRLQAETEGKIVRWYVNDPDNADLIPITSEKSVIFCAPLPGVFRVFCYTAIADVPSEPAVCIVTVGEVVPPIPPPPEDSLVQGLRSVYTIEADSAKTTRVQLLAALYRQASQSTVNDSSVVTWADLLSVMQKARKNLMPDDAIPGIRRALEMELNKTFPTVSTAIDRNLAAKTFVRIAVALEALR